MEEEDYKVLRNEARADPNRYSQWDPQGELRQQYEAMHSHDPSYAECIHSGSRRGETTVPAADHEEVAETLRKNSIASSTSSSSSESLSRTSRLQDIRTAQTISSRSRNAVNTGADAASFYRHPTEKHPDALRRIETQRSQHALTVGATQTPSRLARTLSRHATARPLPTMGADKPYPPPLPCREEFVVEFDGVDDPLHAQNWPMKKKLGMSAVLAFDAISVSMGSSIFSSAIRPVAKQFGVIAEVTTLGTSLYVLGYAFGPLIWAPLSELYGRKQPIVIAAFGYSVFSLAVAVGKDLQTILISRFFAGLFGSCPLAVVAAVFADMFDNRLRGKAVAVFAICVFMGPMMAPFIGGFITESHLGWRWTEYIMSIMGWVSLGLLMLFMKETYPPVVLVSKAAELRRRTKNWGIHAKQEEIEVDFAELMIRNVSRPMRILFQEPIILLVTIYMSFIYGLLYLFLTAYTLVFEGVYGWSAGIAGFTYFGLAAGELLAFLYVFITNPRYVKKLEGNSNVPVPEWRLPAAMIGAPLFSIGLFWFGWSGYNGHTHWIVPVLSGLFTGFGIFSIFLSLLNYIVDSYLMFAASAIAANTFMRSIFAAVFPLFATYMFDGMGIEWASTLLGCVAFICIPMPVVFYLFGKKIRAKSKFAPAPDIELDKRRDEEAKGAESNDFE